MTEILDEELNLPDFGDPDPKDTGIDLSKVGEVAAQAFYDAIQNASNSTARSQQQQDHFIGISNLGHCRQYAALMMKQTPFSDVRDKTAAFFGTVAGDAIEAQLKIDHPDWLIQHKLVFPIPSGGEIPGTCDVLIPWEASVTVEEFNAQFEEDEDGERTYDGPPLFLQGILDGKSKAELETIKKYGPTQQQIWQVHTYARAGIAAGLLNPEHPIVVGDVFFDRSGRDVIPHGVFYIYDAMVIDDIDDWINDVKYAVIQGEDASRDMPREWCWNWCEYATVCRGHDTDVQGLIEDPEILAAVEVYAEAQAEETAAKKKKTKVKPLLENASGSTGTHNVRWVDVEPTEIAGYTRAGYRKLDIRPVPGPKKPKAKKGTK